MRPHVASSSPAACQCINALLLACSSCGGCAWASARQQRTSLPLARCTAAFNQSFALSLGLLHLFTQAPLLSSICTAGPCSRFCRKALLHARTSQRPAALAVADTSPRPAIGARPVKPCLFAYLPTLPTRPPRYHLPCDACRVAPELLITSSLHPHTVLRAYLVSKRVRPSIDSVCLLPLRV